VRVQWALAALVAVVGVVLSTQRTRIIDALGATDDLSMRANLWALARYFAGRQPVQGWGWFGSWDVAEQPFATINQLLAQHHSTALNAYVDIQMQLGWAGLLLLCALGGTALVRSWLDASQRRSVVYAWTPLMLIALAVTSAFESVRCSGWGGCCSSCAPCVPGSPAGGASGWVPRRRRPRGSVAHRPRRRAAPAGRSRRCRRGRISWS
jgi:hypothetical protein